MRSASVGFHCPECVSEGVRAARPGRTVLGGRVRDDGNRLTIALIGANVAVYLLGLLVGTSQLQLQFANLPGTPGQIGVAGGQYYRLLTAAFLHAGAFHLLMNMLALASLGPALEAALGRLRFASLYLLSALGGSVAGFLLAAPGQFSVGASGAIFGLFGAYYVVVRRLGGQTGQILVLLAVNLIITFSVPIIDWRAHLGGLAVGSAVAVAFAYAPRNAHRTQVQVAACAAAGLLLVGLVVARRMALGG